MLLLPLFLLGLTTTAMVAQDIANLFRDGTPIFDLRDRFEYVDQDGSDGGAGNRQPVPRWDRFSTCATGSNMSFRTASRPTPTHIPYGHAPTDVPKFETGEVWLTLQFKLSPEPHRARLQAGQIK